MNERNMDELNKLESLVHKKVITRGGRVVLGYSDLSDTADASPHDKLHDIDSTANHSGVTAAVEDNFMSFNSDGLPKDSGASASSFDVAGAGVGAVSSHEGTYDHTLISDKNKKTTTWINTGYAILATDEVIAYEGGGGDNITLPAATGSGDMYTIKNYSNNVITLLPNGSDLIDTSASIAISGFMAVEVNDAYSGVWIITDEYKATTATAFAYSEVDASGDMVVNNGYITNNISALTMTLPVTSSVGDMVAIVGKGAGGWVVQANAGQVIHHGELATMSGGSVISMYFKAAIQLLCITADTDWAITWTNGNISLEVE